MGVSNITHTMNSKCLYFSIYLSLFLVFEISACNAGGTTTTPMPQTNSTTTKSSGTATIESVTTTTTTTTTTTIKSPTTTTVGSGNTTTVKVTTTTATTTTTTELGNIIFNPGNNTKTQALTFDEQSWPANWTKSNMDVEEIDMDSHRYVMIPSYINGTSYNGTLRNEFQVEDKGHFELEFEIKVENFDGSLTEEANPEMKVELLRFIMDDNQTAQAVQRQV